MREKNIYTGEGRGGRPLFAWKRPFHFSRTLNEVSECTHLRIPSPPPIDRSTNDDDDVDVTPRPALPRIISHIPGDLASFELRWGPLNERDVRDWLSISPTSSSASDASRTIVAGGGGGRRRTLVVNDVDRYHPPLADWMYETFDFLPNWRMDDGQISLAETGGGIGPHVDDYDVFLIQMAGTRTWRVGRRRIGAREERDRTIDGLDVRVLGDWNIDHDDDDDDEGEGKEEEEGDERGGSDELIIARPGDMLYLPPRVSHCGTATSDDCMTLSVGCRAPSASDLMSKLAERLSSSTEDFAVRRYADSDLLRGTTVDGASSGTASPGELTSDAKELARCLVRESLTSMIDDDEWWDEFFGRYATEQKRARGEYPIPLEDASREGGGGGDSNEIAASDEWVDARSTALGVLDGRGVLYQAGGIAFAHSSVHSKAHRGRTSRRFFVNGEMWQSECQSEDETNSLTRLFRVVSNHRRLDRSLLLGLDENYGRNAQRDELSPDAISFLEDLVSAGVLYGSSE